MWTHDPGPGITSTTLGMWAEGARSIGWRMTCHLFHRMRSTRSVPLASRIQLETPGVSWGGVGRAPGGFAPDAGGCPGSGRGGPLKQARALRSKSLCRGSRVDRSDAPCGLGVPLSSSPPPSRSRGQSLTRLEVRDMGLWGQVLHVCRRRRDDILIRNTWVFLLKDHLGEKKRR